MAAANLPIFHTRLQAVPSLPFAIGIREQLTRDLGSNAISLSFRAKISQQATDEAVEIPQSASEDVSSTSGQLDGLWA